MNSQKLASLIQDIAHSIEANEKFALPLIAAKARREAQARPNDVPLINASQVLTKMASDRTFISRKELGEIVERFGASHSKLSHVFSDELGKTSQHKPQTFVRDATEGTVSLDRDYSRFADPLLSNALSGAFEEKPQERLYSQADAQRAHRAAYAQLLGLGLEPKNITTFAGRNDVILCQASYDTPKGISHMLIPVDIHEGKALLPTMFFSTAGFEDLERDKVISHVKEVAGKSFQVNAEKLLNVIDLVKNGSDFDVNEVELAAIKIASNKGTPDVSGIYMPMEEQESSSVELPKMAATEESTFASTLSKPEGIAKFVHGDRVVEAGRSMLVRKFAELGYSPQVKVAEVEDKRIVYAVGLGHSGFKVPVEVKGNMVMPPTVAFADNEILPFTKEAISNIIVSGNGGNKRALAMTSSCYGMKPSELVDIAKKAIDEGHYTRAEEAITVLGEIDQNAQKVAIAYMMMNIYEPGQNPNVDIKEMEKVANQPIKDTPQFMSYKIFFPEGA